MAVRPLLEFEVHCNSAEESLHDFIQEQTYLSPERKQAVHIQTLESLLSGNKWAFCDVEVVCREGRTGFVAVAESKSRSFRSKAHFEAVALGPLKEVARTELFECLELARTLSLDDGWLEA